MRPRTTAATAGADDVDAEGGLPAAGGMSAAVVRREQLDVLVAFPTIDFILDAVVREVHLAIEVRQLVFTGPIANLVLVAARSAVAVRPVAVVVLEELLVLALQVLLENDAADLEVVVLISEACFLLAICRVKTRIVVDLAVTTDASVERLPSIAVAFQGVGIEQVPAHFCENQTALVVPKIDG